MAVSEATDGNRSWYRWYAVGMLAAVYASSQIDRQIMGILLQPIKAELGASDTMMGFLVGLTFALFYATLGIPIAMLADRSNRRNIVAAAVAVWSAMTVVCGFVTTFIQMALARIGVAIGEAGSSPPSHSMISDLFGPHERATAMGLFVFGANVGVLIAYLGGGWMADNWGWRMAFVVVGAPGILLALLFYVTVREPERSTDKDTKDDTDSPTFSETVSYIARHQTLRHILIGKSLGGFVSYGMLMWVPAFLVRTHEMTATQVGVALALIVGVGGGIGTLLSGRIVDALGKYDVRWRVWAIAISKLALIPFTIGFLLIDDLTIALAMYILPAMFGAFYLAPTHALVQQLVKVRMRALAAAIALFLVNMIGMGLGPQGVGMLSDLLGSSFGDQSLRYALTIFLFVNAWCAFHYWYAGRTIANEETPGD